MSEPNSVFLYGASGHAKVVIDIIEKIGEEAISFLVDDNLSLQNHLLSGYSIIGGRQHLLKLTGNTKKVVVSIGDNIIRDRVGNWLLGNDYHLGTFIHPHASLAKRVKIGSGTVIMAGSVINSDSTIENNVIINTKASIDHDCCIKSGVHIGPGTTICGGVIVGKCAFIGAGVTVVHNVQIGANAMIAAGTVVYRNVPANMRIIGVRNEW